MKIEKIMFGMLFSYKVFDLESKKKQLSLFVYNYYK